MSDIIRAMKIAMADLIDLNKEELLKPPNVMVTPSEKGKFILSRDTVSVMVFEIKYNHKTGDYTLSVSDGFTESRENINADGSEKISKELE